jgi:hypothetical protein
MLVYFSVSLGFGFLGRNGRLVRILISYFSIFPCWIGLESELHDTHLHCGGFGASIVALGVGWRSGLIGYTLLDDRLGKCEWHELDEDCYIIFGF